MARKNTVTSKDQTFVHLRVKSSYSLLEGAITPKNIVKLCQTHHMPAVAISDRNNLFGSLEFSLAAASDGIQPIIGCCFSFDYDSIGATSKNRSQASIKSSSYDVLPLIAKDDEGYANLLVLTSLAFTQNTLDGSSAHIKADQLKQYGAGIIALTGGVEGSFGRLLCQQQEDQAEEFLLFLKDIFGDRLYIELMRHGLDQEALIEPKQIHFAYKHNIPLVATNDIYFAEKKIYEAHDALLCIAEGRYLVEEDRRKISRENYFRTPAEMHDLFADIPEAIENTVHIAKRCHILSPTRAPILPHYETDGGRSEKEEFEHLSRKGLKQRLEQQVFPQIGSHMMFADKNYSADQLTEAEKDEITVVYTERLDYELGIISKMEFPGYFLIVSDFIRWSKREGIPVGPGRGSGAGSLVAWSLEITDLDPLRFGLLFERFLNPERVSMPDFDVD
ncbi:MAG: PHP domain-containing protein, partial [Rickettsiales bacterium]|nr:PHP domain-containing protein [Rickettsiales bacterium]